MSFNELRYFIFENYHKRIGFSKENISYALKRLKINSNSNAWNSINSKEHYQSFIVQKNVKTTKRKQAFKGFASSHNVET